MRETGTTVFGFPLVVASPLEMMIAEQFGRKLHEVGEYAFFQYEGKIYIGASSAALNSNGGGKP